MVCTAAALTALSASSSPSRAGRATVITDVNPVVAVALGVALLGERPGAGAVAGLILILAGSWFATGGRLPSPPRRRTELDPQPAPLTPPPVSTRPHAVAAWAVPVR